MSFSWSDDVMTRNLVVMAKFGKMMAGQMVTKPKKSMSGTQHWPSTPANLVKLRNAASPVPFEAFLLGGPL